MHRTLCSYAVKDNRLISVEARLEVIAVPGLPLVGRGDDVASFARAALDASRLTLADEDVLVFTSKILSRAEGRFVDLSTVSPSAEAVSLAEETRKDPRLVELMLRESIGVSRKARDVLVVRHRLGFVVAHAGIDLSNAAPPDAPAGSGPWALLLPENPDASAEKLRAAFPQRIGVVISDSFGRPFRLGSVGTAIGCAGLPAMWDQRGETDLHGRSLEHTITALADQVAAAADLVAGQADEARPLVLVRGLHFPPSTQPASALCRKPNEDLYA
jgi:coenzyme F420-0:L-glutamate ligase/coenzyme F420-1:gamma-L-glutamate ligase